MNRVLFRLGLLAGALLFAAPAHAQYSSVVLEEVPLSAELASTVSTIEPQCGSCSNLEVHAFDILEPSSSVSNEDASWAAIEYLGLWLYGAGPAISQSTFSSRLVNWNYEELPQAIQEFADPNDTAYTVSESYWYYETAPDYCDFGYLYVLVFNQGRKVVTVEVNTGRDC